MTEILLFLLLLLPVSAIFGLIYFKVYINKHQKELEDKSRFISPYALAEIKDRVTALADSVDMSEAAKQKAWDLVNDRIKKVLESNEQRVCIGFDTYKNIPAMELSETLSYLGYRLETMHGSSDMSQIKDRYNLELSLFILLR